MTRLSNILACFVVLFASFCFAQDDQTPSSPIDKEKEVVERFWKVLLQNPRPGTAFERVYSYHIDRGTLPELNEAVKSLTKSEPQNGKVFLLLGLILARENEIPDAENAFKEAEKLLPEDSQPPYYLAQTLIFQGRLREAADSLQKSLDRKPGRAEMITIAEKLGGIYERLGERENATAVWTRLEKAFPENLEVLTRIARTLEKEGKYEDALARFETLAVLAASKEKDRLRFQLAAADLKIRLGNKQSALEDFESILGGLAGNSWAANSVRDRIERLFARQADYAGLVGYYEKMREKQPGDLETIRRLAIALARVSRNREAIDILVRGLEKAPSNIPMRLVLIDLYKNAKNHEETDRLYRKIVELSPNNPDYLTQWGLAVYTNPEIEETEKRTLVEEIWNRIATINPEDAATLLITANLFANHGFSDTAESLYRKAIQLRPADSVYYEYLGVFQHRDGRKEEAINTLWKIADGKNPDGPPRTTESLMQLADAFLSMQIDEEAVSAVAQAVEMEPNRFDLRLRLADLFFDQKDFDSMREQLVAAEKLIESDEERNLHLRLETRRLRAIGELEQVVTNLETEPTELESEEALTLRDWKLAVYQLALGETEKSAQAIERGIARAPQSLLLLRTAGEIVPKTQDYRRAISLLQTLVRWDTARRVDHLKKLASLQRELGETDLAIETAREAVAASGSAGNYRFLAETYVYVRKYEDGIESLRLALRVDPNDTATLAFLADLLFETARVEEAIEIGWRIFDRASNLESKLAAIDRLSLFYWKSGRFEQLVERIQPNELDVEKHRESLFCLSHAYLGTSDFQTARTILESLLTEESTNDTFLFDQLSKIAEMQKDLESAIRYQELLCEINETPSAQDRLLILYTTAEKTEKATPLFEKMRAATVLKSSLGPGQLSQTVKTQSGPIPRNAAKSIADLFESSVWNAENLSREQKEKRFAETFKTASETILLPGNVDECACAFEREFVRLLDIPVDSCREAATGTDLPRELERTVSCWKHGLSEVQGGQNLLRIIMNIRNEKVIELLGTEAERAKKPKISPKLLVACDALEKNAYRILVWQSELSETFPEIVENDISATSTVGMSMSNLKQYLGRPLANARENKAENDVLEIEINPNLISHFLGRSQAIQPLASTRDSSLAVLAVICGTFSAIDDFMKSEKPLEGVDPGSIRHDRMERLLKFFDEQYANGRAETKNRIELVREIVTAIENKGQKVPVMETATIEELKSKALKQQEEFSVSGNETAASALNGVLCIISVVEQKSDEALDYMLRIPSRNASEVKARELLILNLSTVFTADQPLRERAKLSIDRLLGYQLSEDELSEFWGILKSLGKTEEAKTIRDRLLIGANKISNLIDLFTDLEATPENDSALQKAKDQAVYLALKVLRSPTYRAVASEASNTALRKNAVQTLAWAGKLDEVLEQFESQCRSVPGSFDFAKQLIEVYSFLDRKEDAIEILRQIGEMIPPDAATIFEYAGLLQQFEQNDEAEQWTLKGLMLQPDKLLREYPKYQKTLDRKPFLKMLDEIDPNLVQGSFYQMLQILRDSFDDPEAKTQAKKIFRRFWDANPSDPAKRAAGRRSAVRVLIVNDDIITYEYIREWILDILSRTGPIPDRSDENIHDLWRFSNDIPAFYSYSFIETAKKNQKLESFLNELQTVLKVQENRDPDSKNMRRLLMGKVLETVILFELARIEEGMGIAGELQNSPEYDAILSEAEFSETGIVLAMKLQELESEEAHAAAIRFYEKAFRADPHQVYQIFFTCRLYPLYMKSADPKIARRGLEVGLYKLRETFQTLRKIEEEWNGSERPSGFSFEELTLLVEKLGAGLIASGHSAELQEIEKELLKDQTWLEKMKKSEERALFAERIESVFQYRISH